VEKSADEQVAQRRRFVPYISYRDNNYISILQVPVIQMQKQELSTASDHDIGAAYQNALSTAEVCLLALK
jgi:hypothetical protein